MARRWTREERLVLKELYNEVPIEELEIRFGRTVQQIRSQVHYLRKRGWAFTRIKDNK